MHTFNHKSEDLLKVKQTSFCSKKPNILNKPSHMQEQPFTEHVTLQNHYQPSSYINLVSNISCCYYESQTLNLSKQSRCEDVYQKNTGARYSSYQHEKKGTKETSVAKINTSCCPTKTTLAHVKQRDLLQ